MTEVKGSMICYMYTTLLMVHVPGNIRKDKSLEMNRDNYRNDMQKNSTNKEGRRIKCLKHTVLACRTEIKTNFVT